MNTGGVFPSGVRFRFGEKGTVPLARTTSRSGKKANYPLDFALGLRKGKQYPWGLLLVWHTVQVRVRTKVICSKRMRRLVSVNVDHMLGERYISHGISNKSRILYVVVEHNR